MDSAAHVETLRIAAARIGEIAAASPDAPLPSYPGRDVLDLVCHVLTIHEWVAGIVAERLPERPASRTEYDRAMSGVLERYDATWRRLAAVLEEATAGDTVWTFGTDTTVAFWQGRMAHETAIHRWDAERAIVPHPPAIPTDVAVSGLDEGLRIHFERLLRKSEVDGAGERVALRCSDADAAWTVTLREVGVEVADGAPGDAPDARLEGTASDLWLAMAGRIPLDEVAADDTPAMRLLAGAVAAMPPAL
jgi:uncharacterized protein (TIGR03083 family)